MKFISLVLLLASATGVYGRMSMSKGSKSSMMMSSKGKGSSEVEVDLVDTSAEATALHMSGACGSIPDNDWVDACVSSSGVPTRLTLGTPPMSMGGNRALISCCPLDAFDVASIVAYGESFPRGSGPLCSDGSEAAPYAGVVINDRVWCLPPSVVESMVMRRVR